MTVDLEDGACRTCGSQLEITDYDDATLTVLCSSADCGDSYDVEADAFGDGCLKYLFALVINSSGKEKR